MKKVNQFLYGALAIITTALLGTACMDNVSEEYDMSEGIVKLIPFTVSAQSEDATKVSVDGEGDYFFEDGDYLVITSEDGTLEGELKEITSGCGTNEASFKGTLNYTGSGDAPASTLKLTAKLVSKGDAIGTGTFVGGLATKRTFAVQQFSTLVGNSTFGAKRFRLQQGTAFIQFNISMEPAPVENDYEVILYNNDVPAATTTLHIKGGSTTFYGALPAGTLNHAKVTLCDHEFKFAGTLEASKLYKVNRAYYDDLYTPLTFEAAADGVITINIPEEYSAPFTGIIYYKNSDDGVLVTKSDDPPVAYKTTEITVSTGDKVSFYGNNEVYNDHRYPITLNCSNLCYVYGNVMSLIQSSGFASVTELDGYCAFNGLFSGIDVGSHYTTNHITNHPTRKLLLPATKLSGACYCEMFARCEDLRIAPELPAKNLTKECYDEMFADCTSLTEIPDIYVDSVAEDCCSGMFEGCTSLVHAPNIHVTSFPDDPDDAEYCFGGMFTSCSSLTDAPVFDFPMDEHLPASCFKNAFAYCTSLVTAPELPFTLLGESCYEVMFSGCTNLTQAPALPATTLAEECYYEMFHECTSLTTAPELPAKILLPNCYDNMFYNCSSLNYIKCMATEFPTDQSCTSGWTYGVASTGTFVRDPGMNDWARNSVNGIPRGWTVDPELPEDDNQTPLTLQATGSGAILIDNPLHYANIWYTIDGTQYVPGDVDPIEINVSAGQKVCIFGSNATYTSDEGGYWDENDEDGKIWISVSTKIRSTVDCYIYGNIMSLIDPNIFSSLTSLTADYTFRNLFAGNTHLINNDRHLVLPATTLTEQCYENMFMGCTGLTVTPTLPATNLDWKCYGHMFDGCTRLTQLPVLPATTLTEDCYEAMFKSCTGITTLPDNFLPATVLTEGCYNNMFKRCTNLVSVPNDLLPATELEGYCYGSMFEGCTRLERAPELPASRTVKECYCDMFNGCSSLNYIKCLATSLHSDGTFEWVEGVAAEGDFYVAPGMLGWVISPDGIPQGWRVHNLGEARLLTYQLENCTMSPMYYAVAPGSSYEALIRPDESYRISTVSVTMGGADITGSTYFADDFAIRIPSVTADVAITIVADYTDSYNVSYSLSKAEASPKPATTSSLQSFSTTISPQDGANRMDVTVRMGGQIISEGSTNNGDSYLVDIYRVTGDISITATGREEYRITRFYNYGSYPPHLSWDENYTGDEIEGGATYICTFTADPGYYISDEVYVYLGDQLVEGAYNPSTRTVTVTVTNDLRIHVYVYETPASHSVSYHLTNVDYSGPSSVEYGDGLSATLTCDPSYSMTSLCVVINGHYYTQASYPDYIYWDQKAGCWYIWIPSGEITDDITVWASAAGGSKYPVSITYNMASDIVSSNTSAIACADGSHYTRLTSSTYFTAVVTANGNEVFRQEANRDDAGIFYCDVFLQGSSSIPYGGSLTFSAQHGKQ